jgi:hypothetical protein
MNVEEVLGHRGLLCRSGRSAAVRAINHAFTRMFLTVAWVQPALPCSS